MPKFNRHKIHFGVGLFFLPFLLLSSLTGFFRANHKWYWKEDYKKLKNFSYSYTVQKPTLSIDSAIEIVSKKFGRDAEITEMKLKKEVGKLYYHVRLNKFPPALLDASTGDIVSPLNEQLAIAFAGQYVQANVQAKTVYVDNNYQTRKEKNNRPVYVIEYNNAMHTTIFIDQQTGEIEEESDDNLKFGFWMIWLHDYDFLDVKRLNLSLVSIGLVMLGITGIYLAIKKKKHTKNRNSH